MYSTISRLMFCWHIIHVRTKREKQNIHLFYQSSGLKILWLPQKSVQLNFSLLLNRCVFSKILDMKMTDSSLNQGNGMSNGNSNGKRPASSNGSYTSYHPPKIVKFNENNRPSGKDSEGSIKKSGSQNSHLSRQDYLIQRQALPIYPNRQRYREYFIALPVWKLSFLNWNFKTNQVKVSHMVFK